MQLWGNCGQTGVVIDIMQNSRRVCDSETTTHASMCAHILTSPVTRSIGKNGWQSGDSEVEIWGTQPEGCWPVSSPESSTTYNHCDANVLSNSTQEHKRTDGMTDKYREEGTLRKNGKEQRK